MRVATYNIKHAALKGTGAVAQVLRTIDADLVGLQEVDVGTGRSGGVDQAAFLAKSLGRYLAFGPALAYDGGLYGLAILSRWPLRAAETVALPGAGVERRALLVAEVETPDGPLTCAVTHLGLDPAERVVQARAIVDRLRGRERAVLVGDCNAGLFEPALQILLESFTDAAAALGPVPLRTYPAHAPTLGIDHVLVGAGMPLPVRVEAVESAASDHLPVVVDLG